MDLTNDFRCFDCNLSILEANVGRVGLRFLGSTKACLISSLNFSTTLSLLANCDRSV